MSEHQRRVSGQRCELEVEARAARAVRPVDEVLVHRDASHVVRRPEIDRAAVARDLQHPATLRDEEPPTENCERERVRERDPRGDTAVTRRAEDADAADARIARLGIVAEVDVALVERERDRTVGVGDRGALAGRARDTPDPVGRAARADQVVAVDEQTERRDARRDHALGARREIDLEQREARVAVPEA